MNENENVEVEEEIDMSGWDDEEPSFTEAEDETTPETEEETEDEDTETETEESEEAEETEEADQPTEETEQKESETEQEQQKEEPKAEVFTLKHFGETKEYTKEEAVALAQKGLDYDRIRTERDALKADAPKYKDYELFLTEIATDAGVTVDKLIEDIRARALVERESKAGRPLTETAAREQIQKERAARLKAPEPESKPEPEAVPEVDQRQERKKAELQKFAIAHPDVKGTDIPQDVWQEYRDSDSTFEDIYMRRVLYPKLQKQMEELQKQTAEKKQKEENSKRSTGSRKSAGAGRAKDPAFAGWDD